MRLLSRARSLLPIVFALSVAACARGRATTDDPDAATEPTGTSDAAAPLRVVFVDLRRAVTETKEGVRGKEALKWLFDQQQRELEEDHAQLERDVAEANRAVMTMTRGEAKARLDAIKDRSDALDRKLTAYKGDLELREKAIFLPLIWRMQDVIAIMARQEGYEVVFEPRDGAPDVTDAAVAAYDKRY